MVPVHTVRHSNIIIWNFILRWHPGHTLFWFFFSNFKSCSSEQSNVSTKISAIAHLPFEYEKEGIWLKIWIKSLNSQPSFYAQTHLFLSQFFEKQPKFYHYVARKRRHKKFVEAEIIGNDPSNLSRLFFVFPFLKLDGPSRPLSFFSSEAQKCPNLEH